MSSSLEDILNTRKYAEPPEIKIIKDFVEQVVGIKPQVSAKSGSFIVTLPSAAAAGALRFQIHRLQTKVGMKNRIILRIDPS